MARKRLQTVALQNGVQSMAFVLCIELARQAHGAQRFDLEGMTQTLQGLVHKAVVKTHVVSHKYRAVQDLQQRMDDVFKSGCILHHGVGDAGQALDKGRNAHTGVDQGAPARHLHAVLNPHRSDFGDVVALRIAPRGLQVDHHITRHEGRKGLTQQNIKASQAGSSRRLMAP